MSGISTIAQLALRGSKTARKRIAEIMEVHPETVRRWIKDKSDELTKVSIIKIIREETGLTDDQIVEVTTCGDKVTQ
jgi:hypothetical protein